jgi:hypothetical protein
MAMSIVYTGRPPLEIVASSFPSCERVDYCEADRHRTPLILCTGSRIKVVNGWRLFTGCGSLLVCQAHHKRQSDIQSR